MKQITLNNNRVVPALGQGTWHMGQNPNNFSNEVDALRYGMDLGMTLIDTAEMYHDAETVVGAALKGRRDEAFVVSKVLPSNASYQGTLRACEASLEKLQMEHIDLYLLHWPGSHPLEATIDAFENLKQQGKIGGWGVSNFDAADMEQLVGLEHGSNVMTNQVMYNLECRNIEWDLIPWSRDNSVPIMAYSPVNQGNLDIQSLAPFSEKYSATPFQLALAWLLHQDDVLVIPKSSDREHVQLNSQSSEIRISEDDLKALDKVFPPPNRPMPLPIV